MRPFLLSDRLGQVIAGIHPLAVHPHLEVAMRAGGVPGRAGLGDDLTLIHPLAHADQQLGVVGVAGLLAVSWSMTT